VSTRRAGSGLGFGAVAGLSIRRPHLLGAALVLVIAVVGAIAIDREGSPTQEAGGREHCFAEWCIAPRSTTIGTQVVTVSVLVRSDAKQASQRPDHPQAWLIDATGRQIGGPQHELDSLLAAGDSYMANLTFSTSQPGACPKLLVAEGGWPPFFGLGYAPSPFTARVEWRLCEIAG
jgi:hypothetical protein